MPMKNPPHPGRIVRQECIEPLGLTVTDGAKALGVSRNALSELLNERRGISPEMAIRLSKAFGSAPETWAGLQLGYDMAQAMKHADRIKVQKVPQPIPGAE
jgi:addiction module HigA family antidote